jgi:signal transduction histidine kinase/CheY-like chemotaxis protein
MFYLFIERKVDHLNNFTYKSYQASEKFSSNIRNFQNFLLFGFKDVEFYTNHRQKDLDLYILNLEKQSKEINLILKESKDLNIGTNQSIGQLSKELQKLYIIINQFKRIALIRGFKDYGVEGKMRAKAHFLEKHSALNKITVLQFRRHEKDYLLRIDDAYIKKFNALYDSIIKDKNIDAATLKVLLEYKNNFEKLAVLSSRLGDSRNKGLYGDINKINHRIENSFVQIIHNNGKRIAELKETLFYFQIGQSLLMALITLLLSTYISKYFTNDIKLLTIDISNYIKSNFRETTSNLNHKSSIKEVDFLLNSYRLLKEKLSVNILNLEKISEQSINVAKFKTQFLSNMSHEIRSPLNGVIGMLNMLKNGELTPVQSEYIGIAAYSADHLMGIVNMILDHSKMEAGKMKMEQYPINLKTELTKLIRLFEYKIKDKNIKLHFIYDDRIATNVLGDNLRLQQVLINLIDNAIKFTSEGDIKLEVHFINRVDDLQYLHFIIEDSGIGIDASKTEQMLVAFEQADLTTTRKYGGTGLGLTISNQLIQLMGGSKLNIKAAESGGSIFSFEIPLKINSDEILLEKDEILEHNFNDIIIHKALIVEDNIINQKVLDILLNTLEIPADIANNGIEAVSLYSENDYDIIFMDLQMPEMDGFEATKIIHDSTKYKNNPIPIIAVTASAFEEDRDAILEGGMNDIITKPIVLKNLEEIIAKQMRLKNA